MSKMGYYPDTAYYGQGGASPGGRPHVAEDIPLQDHPSKAPNSHDHIYDASGAANSSQRMDRRGKVRIGELGMLGSDRKRIPWIVYIFTLIQIGVFIAEIVKSGKILFPRR